MGGLGRRQRKAARVRSRAGVGRGSTSSWQPPSLMTAINRWPRASPRYAAADKLLPVAWQAAVKNQAGPWPMLLVIETRHGRPAEDPAHAHLSMQGCEIDCWDPALTFTAMACNSLCCGVISARNLQAFPDAVWLSGQQLHHSVRNVAHRWLPVDELTWSATLQV